MFMHLGRTEGAGAGPLGGDDGTDGAGAGPMGGDDGAGAEPLGSDAGPDGAGAGPLGVVTFIDGNPGPAGDDGTDTGALGAGCVLGGATHFVQIVEITVLKIVDTVWLV